MSPSGPDRSHAARVARHGGVSTALARVSDRRLAALVAGAPPVGSGIGGASAWLEVEGAPVFVKRVPLTDLERRPEHVRSTANLFRLPTYCQYGVGSVGIAPACSMVERELRATVEFMNANGLYHFDAHFRNILTDGRRLYFADLGLATSPQFALSAEELAFLADNRTHDQCHTVTELVNWLVTTLVGRDHRDRFIRSCADGAEPVGLPPAAAELVRRYAPIAVVMNDFYRRLHLESRTTPYPAASLAQVCAATGFPSGPHPDPAGT